jgi:hypothetical protein
MKTGFASGRRRARVREPKKRLSSAMNRVTRIR